MGQMLIRNIEDRLIDSYRRAAKANGRSLEAEARAGLAAAEPRVGRSVEELTAISRRFRNLAKADETLPESWEMVREDRDR